MGQVIRRKQLIIVPDKYWTSSLPNVEWIIKESDAKKATRNKTV
jgi:hypothetical protein